MFVFFFEAEDGIRCYDVTGVQTCALPIFFYGGVGGLLSRPLFFDACLVGSGRRRAVYRGTANAKTKNAGDAGQQALVPKAWLSAGTRESMIQAGLRLLGLSMAFAAVARPRLCPNPEKEERELCRASSDLMASSHALGDWK